MPRRIARRTGYGCITEWRANGPVWDFLPMDSWTGPAVWTPPPRLPRTNRPICFRLSSGWPAGWRSFSRMPHGTAMVDLTPPAPCLSPEGGWTRPSASSGHGPSGNACSETTGRSTAIGCAPNTPWSPHWTWTVPTPSGARALSERGVLGPGMSSGANGSRPFAACVPPPDRDRTPTTPMDRSRRPTEAEA